MYTQCPNCNTVFRISAPQLKAAGGRVRCGHCSHVFNALDKLLEHLPPGYTPGTPPPSARRPNAQRPAAPAAGQPAPGAPPPGAKPAPAPTPGRPAAPAKPAAPKSAPPSRPTAQPGTPKAPAAKPSAPSSPPPPAKTPTPSAPAPSASETPPGASGSDKGEDGPLAPPRPWKSKAFDYKRPGPSTEAKPETPEPRRRVSDESKRDTTVPAFNDIQLPGEADSQWSDSTDNATPPDFDLAPQSKSGPKPGPASGKAKSPPGAGDTFDNMDLEDIDGFLKQLAAEVESAGVDLGASGEQPPPTETLVLVDEVSPEEAKGAEAPPPPEPPAPEADSKPAPQPPPRRAPAPEPEENSASFDPLATIEQAPVAEADERVPEALRESWAAAQKRPRGPLATAGGLLLIVLLALGLAAQGVYFRGAEIAARAPALRPWLNQFCELAQCTIPARRALGQLALVSRDVRSDPKAKGALLISATIVNKASFAQPYPDLQVTLYDLTGTVVAERRFKPAEYLAQTPKALEQYKKGRHMPTDTPVNIELAVADPGKQAINYEFDFR